MRHAMLIELKRWHDFGIPWIFGILLIFILRIGYADTNTDIVNIINNSGNEIGLIVDGQNSSGFVNDKNYPSTSNAIDIGQFNLSTETNEIVGFTNDKPPKYLKTQWTNSTDSFNLEFRPEIQLPVTIWIVKGPFDEQKQHAIESLIRTLSIWHNERMGVIFKQLNIINATDKPDKFAHFAFRNGEENDTVGWEQLRDKIGFKDDQLNIYWVDTVEGNTKTGWSNVNNKVVENQIVMGKDTQYDLLAHEIGHAFSLIHIEEFVQTGDFDDENVMHKTSEGERRKYFTEGQLFRVHLGSKSILNLLKDLRPDIDGTRDCDHINTAKSDCPAIQKRIWADGIRFPPN
jgi:hypothetical protein